MKDWRKGCDMGFHVGQQVMTESGAGVVTSTTQSGVYCIEVNIYLAGQRVFLKDGRYRSNDALPSLYPIELTPKFYQPEWQPKQGEWCWFWNEGSKCAIIGQFNYTHNGDTFGGLRYWAYGSHEFNFTNCAPFDGNMTPPWERGEEK